MLRLRRSLALALLFATACSGGDGGTTSPPVVPPVAETPVPPGILAVSAFGLPEGVAFAISVSGPLPGSTFQRSATAAVTWTDVPSGKYTVTVAPARGAAGRFTASPASFDVDVPPGGPIVQAVGTYRPTPSAVLLETPGLPATAASGVSITPPGGTATPTAAGTVHVAPQAASGANTPDTWHASAEAVQFQGARYSPQRTRIDTVVAFGDTARIRMPYEISTGALAVVVSGLPNGVEGAVRLMRGDSVLQTLTATATVTGLEPGIYRLLSGAVTQNRTTYRATRDTQSVTVTASLVAAPATVQYAAQVGRVSISVLGLPTGSAANVQFSGNGVQNAVTASTILDSIPEGTYQLTASAMTAGDERYGPATAVQTVQVTTGALVPVTVQYTVVPTVVDIPVSGLPAGVAASVTVVGPDGETFAVTETRRILPARPGRWRLSASGVTHSTGVYQGTPTSRDTVVAAGDTLRLPVQYTLTTGSLAVAVLGLPSGGIGSVTVTGSGGFVQSLTGTTTLTALTPGSYTVTANAVVVSAVTYQPTPSSQVVTVNAGVTATPATVTYTGGFGAIAISATGVPAGATPVFVLASTGQSSRIVNGTGTATGLPAGIWTVTPQSITSAGTIYTAAPASQQVSVAIGGQASASFVYSIFGSDGGSTVPNHRIASVHLTQAIQRFDGSVPLVADRDALLRVFVVAAQANTARPDVRVRLYDGASLVQSTTLAAPESSVRTSVAEGVLGSTWNMIVPAVHMRPTLRVQVELDPTQAVADSNRADNLWPASGTQAIAVSTVPTFNVRFVPVVVGALVGNVSNANKEQYLVGTRRMFPLRDVVSDVRAPFTSSAPELQSGDENGQWLTVLSEINALRATDGAPSTTHYYGVVKVGYTSGIAGYGYVPGRAAIGWDHLPSGDYVAAHEWGHNFNRPHTPCGVSGDLTYPYAGGVIGQWGWNSTTNALVSPTATDLMGYCPNNWISDHTWNAVLQYRNASGISTSALTTQASETGDGLLVWGRVRNGQISLEPAFRVTAPASPLPTNASHRLDLLDENNSPLVSVPLEANRVDHAPGGDDRQFAVVVPWSAVVAERLSGVRVQDIRIPTRTTTRRSPRFSALTQGAAAMPAAAVELGQSRATVRWSAGESVMAMVTDAVTGQLMGFVRQPGGSVATNGRAVRVQLSDGVRSRELR